MKKNEYSASNHAYYCYYLNSSTRCLFFIKYWCILTYLKYLQWGKCHRINLYYTNFFFNSINFHRYKIWQHASSFTSGWRESNCFYPTMEQHFFLLKTEANLGHGLSTAEQVIGTRSMSSVTRGMGLLMWLRPISMYPGSRGQFPKLYCCDMVTRGWSRHCCISCNVLNINPKPAKYH